MIQKEALAVESPVANIQPLKDSSTVRPNNDNDIDDDCDEVADQEHPKITRLDFADTSVKEGLTDIKG